MRRRRPHLLQHNGRKACASLGPQRSLRAVGLAVWLALLGVAAGSFAPVEAVAAESAEVRANAIYKEAKDLFEGNDFAGALAKAEQAEKVYPHPAILLLKGRILRRLGKLRLAEAALRDADKPELPKPLAKTLADERDALSDDFGRKGELVVVLAESAGSGAGITLSVDGVVVEDKRFERWILAGRHEVEATAPGRKAWARTVDVVAGKTVQVEVAMEDVAGRLVVVVPGGLQGVEIRVDGAPVRIAEGARLGERWSASVAVGSHEVVCSGPGGASRETVRVEEGGAATVTCNGVAGQAASGTASKVVGWSGVAVGSGLFAYGVYNLAYYLAQSADGQVEVVGDSPLAMSRSTGGALYAASGAAVGILSWWLFLRDASDARAAAVPAPNTPALAGR